MKDFNTLSEMYNSREYQDFISEKLGNDLFLSNPERAERIAEYAEDGINGSTHNETIEDWREFLESLNTFDSEYDNPEDIVNYDITMDTYNIINEQINQSEQWHINNGSINDTGC